MSSKRTYTPSTSERADRVPAYTGLYIMDIMRDYDGRDDERRMQALSDFHSAEVAGLSSLRVRAVGVLENIAQRQMMIADYNKRLVAVHGGSLTELQEKYDALVTDKSAEKAARRARSEAREERLTAALETLARRK